MNQSNNRLLLKLYTFYAEVLYYINWVMFPSAKFVALVWLIYCAISLVPSKDVDFMAKVIIFFFGLFLFCGIADVFYLLLCAGKKELFLKYRIRITEQKMKRLRKAMILTHYPCISIKQQYEYAREINSILYPNNRKALHNNYYDTINNLNQIISSKIDIAKQSAQAANKASTVEEYCFHINQCIKILEWLSQFEKYNVYKEEILPSENIRELKYNMPFRIEELKQNPFTNVDNMDGHDFEYFCADLLRKNGFINVEVTQGSGDHGIDVLAEKDDITYAIQCKCYSSNIGNAAVQQAHTGKSLYHKDVAVVMTNQYFTQQAKEEATALRVKLWDRDKINLFIHNAN